MVLTMRLQDLGLIGNCQFAALVERSGAIAWCCLPRFDSEPVFSTLLDARNGGSFLVGPAGGEPGTQRYIENTNVLETVFETPSGSFRVRDFAARFVQYDRPFRPTQIFRIVEPLGGTPRIRVLCDPRLGWSRQAPAQTFGSNHVRYEGFPTQVRLTSDIPISYLSGKPFALTERRHLVLTWGAPIEEPLGPLCSRFLQQTLQYWQRWVKECDVPPLFQHEVIRSALALKLHCFEDTGAIVASTTTSIPEAPGSGRNWDYRYCWLRDAYYALSAFRLLGHFDEREQFVRYLINVASSTPDLDLAPLYRIDAEADLDETVLPDWPGYENSGPVRVGNAAARQRQNDVFGEMVLALSPIYLDERFAAERSPATLDLLRRLTHKAIAVAGTPDAGIWELRAAPRVQTFSSLMCWAAAERMANVARTCCRDHEPDLRAAAARIHHDILANAWSERKGSLAASYGGTDLDASLLQAVSLRLLPADDVRLHKTVDAVQRELSQGGWLMRYRTDDGLGETTVAFVLCTFWLVEALAALGRAAEARALMQKTLAALSPLGLLSEDYAVAEDRLWGNFPQAYSHVGLIHAAFAASPRWSDVL
ncbi:MAG: glycoside hydrolase family 15 protein [Candidatus Fermentibacter sp.]|nr:glycoside hydrolase family 15 protein [Candidatus Fermentibacter sp.]